MNDLPRSRGLTLPESLITIALVSVALLLVMPVASNRIRKAQIRIQADLLENHLRAARMTAVSNGSPVNVTVGVDPLNTYQYTNAHGEIVTVPMPESVRIVGSDSPIRFLPNGSVLGGATTTLETELRPGLVDQWVVTTSPLGISRAEDTP